MPFDDLLAANAEYARNFQHGGFDGIARAGVAIVTCMDSRIDPLALTGLKHGDAKILRNPGGRVTPDVMEALVLSAHLLGVKRIMIVPHTRCAVASSTEDQIRTRVSESAGKDASWLPIHVITDQVRTLAEDVHAVKSHPLVPESIEVGGFIYDVDTGQLSQKV